MTEAAAARFFWAENHRPGIAPETNCTAILLGDKAATAQAKEYTKSHPKKQYPDSIFLSIAQNCTDFKMKRGYVTESLMREAEEFPIAFSILYYKDLVQVERLLRAIYRPNNVYCLHMDAYRYG